MPFPSDIREEALVRSHRRCCVCHTFAGRSVNVHHIKQESEGGENILDNAIVLCLKCHAEAGHYNAKHPIGNKYYPQELVRHRDNWWRICESNGPLSENSQFEIIELKMSTKSWWTEFMRNTSRQNEKNKNPIRPEIMRFENPPIFPYCAFQKNLIVTEERKKEIEKNLSQDPILDVSVINNTNDTIVIKEYALRIDDAWSLPKAMPTTGKLMVSDAIILEVDSRDAGRRFFFRPEDPTFLTPKAPCRFEVWLRGITDASGENELLTTLELDTSHGKLEFDGINLSFL